MKLSTRKLVICLFSCEEQKFSSISKKSTHFITKEKAHMEKESKLRLPQESG
jgi:hypothetical protein